MQLIKKEWNIPNSGTYVSYRVVDKDGKKVFERINVVCFRDLTYKAVPEDAVQIEVWWAKANTAYSQEEIEQWLTVLRSYKFWVWFVKEEGAVQHYRVVLNDPRTGVRINRFVLASTLSLLRVLYEGGLNHIPGNFFLLKKRLPQVKNLYLLQLAHCFLAPGQHYEGNWNHTIKHTAYPTALLTARGLAKHYRNSKPISKDGGIALMEAWNTGHVSTNTESPEHLCVQLLQRERLPVPESLKELTTN